MSIDKSELGATATVPFGARFACPVPEDTDVTDETRRAYLDPDRQIAMVRVDGADVPMMSRRSGQTKTSTNSQDRQSSDDDTDVGQM
ncbi:putative ATP-grasp target RiPP [Nocardiopsis mwathae]|uniref:Putative ATP-grasp target RiPP n=1 Tax=Nocardiopsis mwathae TaxID=1472723 RepID=A0A7W9YIE8_9ACTN|nr:putative ATP-grasp target RiPP [Nocardiopsis mwathae]